MSITRLPRSRIISFTTDNYDQYYFLYCCSRISRWCCFQLPPGCCREDREVHNKRTRDASYNRENSDEILGKKNTVEVVKHWNTFPGEAVASPSMHILKAQQLKAPNNLI